MKVLQLIDSLNAGGAERVAVNLANALAFKIEGSYLCATREEGILKESINDNVGYLLLKKNRTIDLAAIRKFNKYLKSNNISVIHAHSSSFFLATIAKILNKKIKIIWHDHHGNRPNIKFSNKMILKFCSLYFSKIIVVNNLLKEWAENNLKTTDVTYLENFVYRTNNKPVTTLEGIDGKRIICLANFRPQKDHSTLVKAFKDVLINLPEWTLHCVGKDFNDVYSRSIRAKIDSLNLSKSIYLYNSRPDVFNILEQCDIAVLSSKIEGLPLALLEYGLANLPVIATRVGECETVLGNESNGILIDAENTKQLRNAILDLINNEERRKLMANNYRQKIESEYSADAVMDKLVKTYKIISVDKR